MLTQKDVVNLIAKDPSLPQHVCYQILHAYVHAKSARGNLPSETLSKVLAIHRKLLPRLQGPLSSSSAISRAFEAIKSQLIQVNRKWLLQGPQAFGALGAIGAASNEDAKWAWMKATDGKIKVFPPEEHAQAIDAGRIVGPGFGMVMPEGAPPMYSGPPTPAVDAEEDPFVRRSTPLPPPVQAPAVPLPSSSLASEPPATADSSPAAAATTTPLPAEDTSYDAPPPPSPPATSSTEPTASVESTFPTNYDPVAAEVETRERAQVQEMAAEAEREARATAPKTQAELDLEAGRSHLALMRERRLKEEEEAQRKRDEAERSSALE